MSKRKETKDKRQRKAKPREEAGVFLRVVGGAVSEADLAAIRAHARRTHGHVDGADTSCATCNPECPKCGYVDSKTRFRMIASAAVEVNDKGQQSGGLMALDGYGYVWQYWPARYADGERTQYARWVRLSARRVIASRDGGAIRDEFLPEHG